MKVFHQDRVWRKRMAVGVLAASMLASVLGMAPSANAAQTVYVVDDCSAEDFVHAVEVANVDANLNNIVLEKGCTYEFAHPWFDEVNATMTNSALPVILQPLTIWGKGAKVVSDVEGAADPYSSFRFLRTDDTANPAVTIKDLTVSDFEIFQAGSTGNFDDQTSGCILNEGTGKLTLSGVTLKDCEVFLVDLAVAIANSGAVLSVGDLTMKNSTVKNSSVSAVGIFGIASALAGGVGVTGDADIASSTIKGNSATGTGLLTSLTAGGGLVTNGELKMSSSTVSKNTASARAGNVAISIGAGGGISLADLGTGASTISNSTVDGNKAKAEGGGLLPALAVAGGLLNVNTGDSAAPGNYGLVVDTTGKTKITNNKASCEGLCGAVGGGYANTFILAGLGTAQFNNTVFKGNVADGDDGAGLGGGLYLDGDGSAGPDGTLETVLNNATVTKNTAKGDTWAAGGGLFTTDAANVDIDDSSFSKNKPENCFAFTGSIFCDL